VRRIRLGPGGPLVDVVPDDVAATADIVVCVRQGAPVHFPDDVLDVCAGCGVGIRYRPYIPKRPMKLCVPCAVAWAGPN
jgi:hypothetical protein